MNLGDVAEKSVPKMTMVAPPRHGGAIMTRSFIPHRCHASIGVFGALSVATACLQPGSPAHELAAIPDGKRKVMRIEHPTGQLDIVVEMGEGGEIAEAAFVRTARKLFDGVVFPRD
jgi:4-oxalomesaconate tautomerase